VSFTVLQERFSSAEHKVVETSPVVQTINRFFAILDIPDEVDVILRDKDSVSPFSNILFF
jgi:hypothetical protein